MGCQDGAKTRHQSRKYKRIIWVVNFKTLGGNIPPSPLSVPKRKRRGGRGYSPIAVPNRLRTVGTYQGRFCGRGVVAPQCRRKNNICWDMSRRTGSMLGRNWGCPLPKNRLRYARRRYIVTDQTFFIKARRIILRLAPERWYLIRRVGHGGGYKFRI